MKLKPIFKDYLWGGEHLATIYGKPTLTRPLAESWEISCHPDGLSIIENGVFSGRTLADLLAMYPAYIGGQYFSCNTLPILVKLIDANQSLSLQVHPSDEDAERIGGRREGKNEMWYVLDAVPEAKIIMGFQHPINKDELHRHIQDGTIMNIVREVPVKKGDCFSIPAGMLHAIGAGITLAEVQQNSNLTYRVYDFDRRDKDGNCRELHIDKAMEVIDTSLKVHNSGENLLLQYDGYDKRELISWQWFHTNLLKIHTSASLYCGLESFVALICVEGTISISANDIEIVLSSGESAFLPAGLGAYTLQGKGDVLSTTCL